MSVTVKKAVRPDNDTHTVAKPFISVIVPIHNEEKHIERCLMSILQQDYGVENLEIIVVDGMSDDKTRPIVKKLQKRFPVITLLDNPQQYVPFALNKAIARAKGEIIARVDGHAAIEKDYLTQCVRTFRETGSECVGGQIIGVNDSVTGKAIALGMSSGFGVGNARFRTGGEDGYVDTVAFAVYRRKVFYDIGLFDEFMVRSQDDEFNFRLRDHGGKVYFTSRMRSKYYPRSSIRKLWRQYFGYGLYKVRLFQKYPTLMQPRHFVPLLFVLALLGSGLLALSTGVRWPFFAITASYATGALLFSAKISAKQGWQYMLRLPVIFATLHLSYGLGFLWGLTRFALLGHKTEIIPQLAAAD